MQDLEDTHQAELLSLNAQVSVFLNSFLDGKHTGRGLEVLASYSRLQVCPGCCIGAFEAESMLLMTASILGLC